MNFNTNILFFIIQCFLVVSCSKEKLDVPSYEKKGNTTFACNNGIPVINIETTDGDGITDKSNWKDIKFSFQGNAFFESWEDSGYIKGRGNSTFRLAKKPFNVKFYKKKSLLGMSNSKKWVFLANYRDPTLMRNDITFRLGQLADNLEWTPHGEFVDMVFNGNYVGNYYVCEKINVNKYHVDIDEMCDADTIGVNLTGGYLLQIDKYYDEINKFKTSRLGFPIEIISPEPEMCQRLQIEYIKNYIDNIEIKLQTEDFRTLYENYIDLPSFIDYYIVQIVAGNSDFHAPHSVYMYKKRNGKLYMGPLWDFDFSTYYHEDGIMHFDTFWYKYLFKDRFFIEKLKERWNRLKPIFEADIYDYILKKRQYIFLSALENFKMFNYDTSINFHNIDDSGFIISQDRLVDVLKSRIKNIDRAINGL